MKQRVPDRASYIRHGRPVRAMQSTILSRRCEEDKADPSRTYEYRECGGTKS